MLSRVMRSTFGRTILRIVLGQFLAMCMSVTGLFTTLLVEDKSSLPLLQSVTAYGMICVLFFFVYTFFVVRNKDYINQKYVAMSSNDHLGGKDVKRSDPQQKGESQIISSDFVVSDRDDDESARERRERTERHRREDNESRTKILSDSSACHSNATPLIVSSSSSYQQQITHNRREQEEEKETDGVNTDRNRNNIINESDMRLSSEGYATFSVLSPSSPSPSRRPPHTSLTVNSSNSNTSISSNCKGHRELKQEDRSPKYPFISSTLDTVQQYFTSSLSSGYKGVGASLWRFAVIAFIDLEANFAVVYAYQHTDITSVQLLDCSSIVWVMILSRFLLGTRYKPLFHLVGVGVAVVGIILLIVFDATNMNRHGPSDNGDGGDDSPANMTAAAVSSYFFSSTTAVAASNGGFSNSHLFMSEAKQEDPTSPQPRAPPSDHSKRDIILGDMLCLVSSLLYAISNVMCERLVKKSVENAEGDEKKGRGEEEEDQEKQSEDERDEQKRDSRKEEDTMEEAYRQESGDSVQQHGNTLAHNGRGGKSASLLLQKEDNRRLREETSVADADAVHTLRTDAVIVTNQRCDDQRRDSCEDPCDGQTSVRPDHSTKYSGHQLSVTPESLACCREKSSEKNKIAIPTRSDIRDPNLCAANSSRENSRETSLLETTPDDKFVPSLEWIVIIEYLFWMPFFGALFGSIQFWATGEFKNLPPFFASSSSSSSDSSEVPAFDRVSSGESYVDLYYQFGFGGAMLVIYTLMPVLFYVASATFANLSLLTSDIFSVFWNVVIFGIYPKPTFFVSFVLILVGVVIFDTNGLEALRQRRRG